MLNYYIKKITPPRTPRINSWVGDAKKMLDSMRWRTVSHELRRSENKNKWKERCVWFPQTSGPRMLNPILSLLLCAKHWRPGCKTIKVQGWADRPVDPPSIFGITNRLCFSQSIISPSRDIENRTVTAESRTVKKRMLDKIDSWNHLIKYCDKYSPYLLVNYDNVVEKSFRFNECWIFSLSGADPEGGFGDLSPLNFLEVKII